MTSLLKNRESIKLSAASVILVANAFVWYFIVFRTLGSLVDTRGIALALSDEAIIAEKIAVLGANAGAIAVAGFIGTLVVGRFIQHKRFLYAWITSGIALSLLPVIMSTSELTDIAILSVIFGIYFGIGMPATMGFHSQQVKTENRAKLGGFIFLLIGITFAITSFITGGPIIQVSAILAAVRVVALITLGFMGTKQQQSGQVKVENESESKVSFRSILSNRSFIVYFIPWLMFTLINYMTVPIQARIYSPDISSNVYTYPFHAQMETAVTAVVAVISGFLADKIGRKRLSIMGFILLGIGYATMGLASAVSPSLAVEKDLTLFSGSIIFAVVDGAAWGIFYVLFLFTVWGDLAHNRKSDKFYFLGALPYVSAYFMQLELTTFLSSIPMVTYFSFASVFLFLAVLPLIYAPETLPEAVMKDRDLKSYIEKAKKKAVKDTEKAKKRAKTHKKTDAPAQENSYDEAKKLAEKFY